jgi:predicted enzyme related to lactoylglutathione lyase
MEQTTKTLFKALDTVWCPVADMDRAVAFYRDVLGLTPDYESPYWTSFKVSADVHLGLHAGPMPEGSGFVVGFLCDDLRALRGRLSEAGFEAGEYHDIPRGVVMDVFDPDDNRLQATQLGVKAAELRD